MSRTLKDQLIESFDRRGSVETSTNCLVVQGGGMRGVYSMGVLAGLEAEGLSNVFDLVVGSSAGAINGAYFLAGQAEDAVGVYVDHLSSKDFVNFARWSKIVDIDFLVDEVLKKRCPLDVPRLRASSAVLEVIVTDAETGVGRVFSNKDDDIDFYELIRATAALPTLYNRQVPIDGRAYIDGGVADALPVLHALERNPRNLMAVSTKALGHRRLGKSAMVRSLGKFAALRQSRSIRDKWGVPDPMFNQSMDLLEGRVSHDTVDVWGIYPSDMSRMAQRTTIDRVLLQDCANLGREDARFALRRDLPWT